MMDSSRAANDSVVEGAPASLRYPSNKSLRDLSPAPISFASPANSARQRFSSPRVPPIAGLGRSPSINTQDGPGATDTSPPHERSSAGSVSGGGTVTMERTKLLRETSMAQETALAGLQNEQRRLVALQRDVAEVQRQNDELRQQMAAHDVRALREANNQLQARADEVAKLEATRAQLQAKIDRRGAVEQEVEALRPALAEAQALENELRELKALDAKKDGMRREIAGLQSKVEIVHKLKRQLTQLQTEFEETEVLQAQVAAMAAQADQLPALKVLHAKKQASSAEARQLERSIAELEKQEAQYVELAARLPLLQAKVADFEDLKQQVEAAQEAARSTEALRSRLHELSRTAALLPSLQAEETRLADAAAEAQALDKAVMALMPAAAQLQSVKHQHQQLTAAVAEVAAMQARVAELKDVEAQRAALVKQLEDMGVRDEGASYADVRGMERAVSSRYTPQGAPPAPAAALTSHGSARLDLPQILPIASQESSSNIDLRRGSSSGGGAVAAAVAAAAAAASAGAGAPLGTATAGSETWGSALSGLALDDTFSGGSALSASPGSAPLSQRQQALEALRRQLQQEMHAQLPATPAPSFVRTSSGGNGRTAAPGSVAAVAALPPLDTAQQKSSGQATTASDPPSPWLSLPPPAPSSASRLSPTGAASAERSVKDLASLHEAAAILQELEAKRAALRSELEAMGPAELAGLRAEVVRKRIIELEDEASQLRTAASDLVIFEETPVDLDGEFPEGHDDDGAQGSPGAVEDGGMGGTSRRLPPVGGATSVSALRSQFSSQQGGGGRTAEVTPRLLSWTSEERRVKAEVAHLSPVANRLPQLQQELERLTAQVAQVHALEAQVAELQSVAGRLPELQAAAADANLNSKAQQAASLLAAPAPFTSPPPAAAKSSLAQDSPITPYHPIGSAAAAATAVPPILEEDGGGGSGASSFTAPPSPLLPYSTMSELQRRYEELAPLEAEAILLAAEVQRLAPLRGAIGVVREEHAHLISLLHEHNRLEADAGVLRMQVAAVSRKNSLKQFPDGPDDVAGVGASSPELEAALAKAASGAGGSGAEAKSEDEVYQCLRQLTAERVELVEENDALREENDDLRERLAASVQAINKLKTLATAVENIRNISSIDRASRSHTTGGVLTTHVTSM